MSKKTSLFSILLLVVGLFLASAVQAATNKHMKIGFAVSTQDNPFFVDMKQGIDKKAKELGIQVLAVDAQNDSAKQLNSIEDLITKGVKVLIVNPVDGDAVVSAIEDANAAHIPVITVDRDANGGKIISHIASNNIAGGKMAADFIAKKLNGKGNVVELEGIPGTSAARDRGKGFDNEIKLYKGIKIIAKQPADFDRAKGMSVMENILQTNKNIDAVFAHNDSMALGAMEAIDAAGRSKKIIIVGFDAISDARKAVKNGGMTATIAQQPVMMGELSVEEAQKIMKNQKVPKNVDVPLKLIDK